MFSCKKDHDIPAITRLTGERFLSSGYGNIDYRYEADDAGRLNRYLVCDTSGLIRTSGLGSDSVVAVSDMVYGHGLVSRYIGSVYGGKPSSKRVYNQGSSTAIDSLQFTYDGSGRVTKIVEGGGFIITDISYDGKGNIARIYQLFKSGSNYIIYADITPVYYDNHPTAYSLAGKGSFFVSGTDNAQADIRYLMMLGKNNPKEVHIRAFDQSLYKQITYQAVIDYSYNEKGYPTDMAVTASDSLSFFNNNTNVRLMFKDHFNYQDF